MNAPRHDLRHAAWLLGTALVISALTACDIPPFDAPAVPDVPAVPEEVPELPDVPEVPDLAAQLEAAIFEKLQCEEIARPSTLARVRDVLRDPTFEEVQALLTNPQDLATVVAMAGAEVEGAVIVARNLERLMDSGTARALVEGGWDGVSCGAPVTVACTAGDETTTVGCEGESVSSVAVDFALCTLGGTVHDGAMTFERIEGVATSARVTFAGLAFDEIKVLDGALALAIDEAGDAAGLRATLDGGLAYTEHGGPDGGLACGARLSLDALELDVGNDETTIELAGARRTVEDTLAIETTGALRFPAASTCACPLPGGGLRVEVPRPLGRAGESAMARVEFVQTTDPALCAAANVTLEGWPTTCALGGDCARAATEATLAQVMSALCTDAP